MKVRFLPSNHVIEVEPNVTLFEAAQRAGLPVGSSCGAAGTCGRCGLRIVDGSLSPPTPHEIKVVQDNRVSDSLRLSCMVSVTSDITVTADYW